MQEAQASHCEEERKAAADTYDAWDTPLVALSGAAFAWVAACRRIKTPTQALVCAGASLALTAAMAHEKSCRRKAASADTAFYDCLREHSNSGG